MRAHLDSRVRPRRVVLTMHLEEFREHVEWLELISPDDGCTRDYRAELDRIDPDNAQLLPIPDSWRGPKRG